MQLQIPELSPGAKKTIHLFLSEFVGMALLMIFGLGLVLFIRANVFFKAPVISSPLLARFCYSFLFGTVGFFITVSPVGKISGAHLNPVISLSFWLRGKMKAYAMVGYMASQMLGAVAGCLPFLMLSHHRVINVQLGVTTPGPQGNMAAYLGETMATSFLIAAVYILVGSKALRNYTPYVMPFLSGILAAVEAYLSGCSTNPARSFGPAVVGNIYTGFWIYVIGPVTGVLLITGVFKWFRLHHYYRIEAARLSYHDQASPQCLKSS